MENLNYYHATENDIPFITQVYNENLEALHGVVRDEAVWEKLLRDESSTYYIVSADMPMAWFRTEVENGQLWLGMLQVKPAYQRKGIGKYILGVFEAMARESDFQSVGIHTTNDNLPAQALYEGAGYHLTEIGPCTTADGIERIGHTYEKTL